MNNVVFRPVLWHPTCHYWLLIVVHVGHYLILFHDILIMALEFLEYMVTYWLTHGILEVYDSICIFVSGFIKRSKHVLSCLIRVFDIIDGCVLNHFVKPDKGYNLSDKLIIA